MKERQAMLDYYAARAEREWDRLASPAHDGPVEFAVHTSAIATYLSQGSRVLDIGGGPGRYALWLAERGHRVVLADLSPVLLDAARRRISQSPAASLVDEIVQADARDLNRWPDASFDAVLSLGPFYHLPVAADRDRACRELVRVLHPGGLAFIAVMPVYAFLRRTLALADERPQLGNPAFLEPLLECGHYVNALPERFTGCHGVRPEEVAPYFERQGLTTLALLAAEGFTNGLGEALADLQMGDQAAYERLLELVVQTASDPSLLGMSAHLLYVGRR
jgi:SAM-dependent methyltransferase